MIKTIPLILDELHKITNYDETVDLLQIAGATRDERLYTNNLYFLLNSKSELVIKLSFFKMLTSIFRQHSFENLNFQIYREYSIGSGFVDLLILTEDGSAIVIENKIDADDQPDQLERYFNYFSKGKYNGKTFLVYLTPYGNDPSEKSIKAKMLSFLKNEGMFANLSYQNHILPWLEDLSEKTTGSIIKSAIIQFKTTIRSMLNMNKRVLELVNHEFQNIKDEDINDLQDVKTAIDILIFTKKTTSFFSRVYELLIAKGVNSECLLFECNNKTYKDKDCWERSIMENGYKYYGILFSLGQEYNRPEYGIRLSTEGFASQYK